MNLLEICSIESVRQAGGENYNSGSARVNLFETCWIESVRQAGGENYDSGSARVNLFEICSVESVRDLLDGICSTSRVRTSHGNLNQIAA